MTTRPDIFNDYDDNGNRRTVAGTRSSRIADNALLDNLRFRWPQLSDLSDQRLVNEYDEFAVSDMFGDNDARFLEWLEAAL